MQKISVITVCLNAAEVISRCIQSVDDQDYPNIEHVFIDGGSRDGTVDVIKSVSGNMTYLSSEKDGGIYEAMNKGISAASGEIIAILNADDRYAHSGVLSLVAAGFADGEAKIVYGGLVYETEAGEIEDAWRPEPFRAGAFGRGWQAPHPAVFVHRDGYETAGVFNTAYRVASDLDMELRLFEKHRLPAILLDEDLVIMSLGGISSTARGKMHALIETILMFPRNGLFLQGVGYIATRLFPAVKKHLRRALDRVRAADYTPSS